MASSSSSSTLVEPCDLELTECSICLSTITNERCELLCGHVFHSTCLVQSALHDPRCALCRTQIVSKPAEPTSPQNVMSVSISMEELNTIVESQASIARQQQRQYDARRRRFLRSRPQLREHLVSSRAQHRELAAVERQINREWWQRSQSLWREEPFASLRKTRTRMKRSIRRRERIVETVVVAALGERPQSDDDEDDEDYVPSDSDDDEGSRNHDQSAPNISDENEDGGEDGEGAPVRRGGLRALRERRSRQNGRSGNRESAEDTLIDARLRHALRGLRQPLIDAIARIASRQGDGM